MGNMIFLIIAIIAGITLVAFGLFVIVPVSYSYFEARKKNQGKMYAKDAELIKLNDQYNQMQMTTNETLTNLTSELAQLNKRTSAIEKLLREVE